jgi:hypothetical protein
MPWGKTGGQIITIGLLMLLFFWASYKPPQVAANCSVVISPTLNATDLSLDEPAIYYRNGAMYVVGVVGNTGREAVSMARVEIDFVHTDKGLLNQAVQYFTHLNPGEKKPYRLMVIEEEAVAAIHIRAVDGSAALAHVSPLQVENLLVEEGDGGFIRVAVEVLNRGDADLELAKILLSFIDGGGLLLDSSTYFIKYIAAGAREELSFYCRVAEGWETVRVNFD